MSDNYSLLVERISASSRIDKSEIEKKIEARRAKLSGLISKEGAAQIIAAELGVRFDDVQLKVSEILPGMKKVNVVGKVINLFPVRSFDKNGRKGKVLNFILADQTGSTRVVLWDTNHISLFEESKLNQGDVVEIRNASSREGEVHLSGFSELIKSNLKIDSVKNERSYTEIDISAAAEGKSVNLRGLIVQVFAPRFFSVCSVCGKKVTSDGEGFSCSEHGKVATKDRALLNVIIDDGSESLRAVIFSDQLEKLISIDNLKDTPNFLEFKEDILGTEYFIKGVVKKNSLFNILELTCQDLQKVQPELLISQLESKD